MPAGLKFVQAGKTLADGICQTAKGLGETAGALAEFGRDIQTTHQVVFGSRGGDISRRQFAARVATASVMAMGSVGVAGLFYDTLIYSANSPIASATVDECQNGRVYNGGDACAANSQVIIEGAKMAQESTENKLPLIIGATLAGLGVGGLNYASNKRRLAGSGQPNIFDAAPDPNKQPSTRYRWLTLKPLPNDQSAGLELIFENIKNNPS